MAPDGSSVGPPPARGLGGSARFVPPLIRRPHQYLGPAGVRPEGGWRSGYPRWPGLREAWPGLRSLIRVQAERNGPRGGQRSVRYCISSRSPKAEALLDLVRGHWGVENGLHRTLDVQFREDDCRMRKGHAPAVMAILRRTALNMLRTIQRKLDTDVSIGLLRDRIGRQPWILAAALP